MENERLLQILDNSACLTNRQMTGYMKHDLFPEELRVVELHLSGCPFCSDALEGLAEHHEKIDLVAGLPMPVLPAISLPEKPKEKPKEKKEQDPVTHKKPAPAKYRSSASTHTPSSINRWKAPVGIAAALIVGFGALWYFKFNQPAGRDILAMNTVSEDTNTALNEATANQLKTDARQEATNPEVNDAIARTTRDSTVLAQANPAPTPIPIKKADSVVPAKPALTVAAADEDRQPTVAAARTEQGKDDTEIEASKTVAALEKAPQVSAAKERKQEEKQKDPPATRSNFKIGMEQYKQQEYNQAIGYFKQAEANPSDPNHWEAVYYTGMSYKALGKKRKAIKQFKQVLDGDHRTLKAAAQKQLDEMK